MSFNSPRLSTPLLADSLSFNPPLLEPPFFPPLFPPPVYFQLLSNSLLNVANASSPTNAYRLPRSHPPSAASVSRINVLSGLATRVFTESSIPV